ncbi:glycosyltransferase family 2 protein [bacterium]|nr:glycosyltransferase family 2 protein [bacterium]
MKNEMNSPLSTGLQLSVVVPCFNENPHIESILEGWLQELRDQRLSFEIIAINDGSLDGTGRVLDKLRKENPEIRVVHQLNTGSAKAYRRGYELARGQYVLSISANGRCEPSDFQLLWNQKTGSSLVIARRTHRLDGFFSRKFTSFLSLLARRLFKLNVEEPGIGFRLFLREPVIPLLKDIPKEWHSFHWSSSVLVATHSPNGISEVKVPYRHRLERKSPFRRTSLFKSGWYHLREGLFLKWQLRGKAVAHLISPFSVQSHSYS